MVKPGKTINWQVFVGLFVLFLFTFLIFLTSPAYSKNRALQQETPTPVSETITAAATPLPEEWVKNAHQTDGVALGGTILVMIVIVGTLGVLMRKPARTTSKKFKRN
jgi:hypothetical protein